VSVIERTTREPPALRAPSPDGPRPEAPSPGARGPESLGDSHHRPPGGAERDANRYTARAGLVVLSAIALGLFLQLTVVSGLQHRVAQQAAFDQFRKELAEGTAPLGQTDVSGRLLRLGTPVALLEIPSLHVHEVVREGTTSSVLMGGPGHRRDTPLPGQAGTSVVMARAAAFGGPFRGLHHLRVGAHIILTTGQGVSTFAVMDIRHAGSPTPPPVAADKGRLTLITAQGTPFVPSGVLRVDANLATQTLASPASVLPSSALGQSEQAMSTDTSTLWALVLWLEVLIAVAVGAVWSWMRWGHQQTWIVFLPLTGLVAFYVAGQFARLLPNLM
jgi:sortase A